MAMRGTVVFFAVSVDENDATAGQVWLPFVKREVRVVRARAVRRGVRVACAFALGMGWPATLDAWLAAAVSGQVDTLRARARGCARRW